MKKTVLFAILISLVLGLSAQTKDAQIKELIASADKLRDANNEALAITKYDAVLKLDPTHYEALHSISLMYSRVGNRFGAEDQAKKVEFFNKAKSYAEKAMQANPTDAEGQFVMGVAMGRMALISDAKGRVAASKDIKKYAEAAIRYNPQHAGAWDILGRWNTKVANLSFAEKAAANLLFGGVPEGASNENAIRCFQNALTYKPNYILYMYDLATSYYQVKNIAKCKELLNALIALPPVTLDDPGTQKEAKMMLSSIK
jgi:regulator of microtubule dynamics protein 3